MPQPSESAPQPERESEPQSQPEPSPHRRRRRYLAAVLMTLAILLLLGSIGYISFRRLDVNPIGSPTPLPTPTPSATPSPTPSATPTPGTYDLGQAFSQVQAFYSDYQQNAGTLSKYVTPQLAQQLNAGGSSASGVYCTFNVPSSISYTAPVAGNNSATVVADESFVNNPDIDVTLTVSLSTLQITAIACPQ